METKESSLKLVTIGYWLALVTSLMTLLTFSMAVGTPPLSGPFCQNDCLDYPYANIAGRFPRDYYWMYAALLLTLLYLVLMLVIHQTTTREKKLFSYIGIAFALMATLILSVDYFIQLSVIQPSVLSGETEGIALLSQFNPHGIFIVLEELGFIFMLVSFLALVPVFGGKVAPNRAIRLTIIAGSLFALVAWISIVVSFGIFREYRFEVAVISIAWMELFVVGMLLVKYFRNMKKALKA